MEGVYLVRWGRVAEPVRRTWKLCFPGSQKRDPGHPILWWVCFPEKWYQPQVGSIRKSGGTGWPHAEIVLSRVSEARPGAPHFLVGLLPEQRYQPRRSSMSQSGGTGQTRAEIVRSRVSESRPGAPHFLVSLLPEKLCLPRSWFDEKERWNRFAAHAEIVLSRVSESRPGAPHFLVGLLPEKLCLPRSWFDEKGWWNRLAAHAEIGLSRVSEARPGAPYFVVGCFLKTVPTASRFDKEERWNRMATCEHRAFPGLRIETRGTPFLGGFASQNLGHSPRCALRGSGDPRYSRSGDRLHRFLYPLTLTPENDSTANPRTGWPKKRAGAKRLKSSMFST